VTGGPPPGEDATFVVPVTPDGKEWLSFLPGRHGWANFRSELYASIERAVFVRFGVDRPLPATKQDGMYRIDADHPNVRAAGAVIREVHLAFREGVGPRAMRDVPLSRIEAAVNQPAYRAAVLERCSREDVIMAPFNPDGPVDWWRARPERTRRRPNLKVRVPEGRNRPDSFYEQVAERFSYLTTVSQRPATELAEANDVPVTTVHGWVKEARRRGLLPTGERTKGSTSASWNVTVTGTGRTPR
jgi:transposase-like protein